MEVRFTATAAIKLVIWDMDDTFWTGTLSEGEITLIPRNIEIVKTLVDRGIMSSVASKNDLDPVKSALSDAGVWDFFIFPQVSWNAKGGSIATILEHANLRPDNVLFVDDNSLNIEEIRFRFPTMMVGYPEDVLPILLELDHAQGKNDKSHSRLKQYKQLEKKVSDQQQATLSNEEFLKQCDIKLRFEYDVEKHLDRIIELINRSNQLNFTKKRIETPDALSKFKADLSRHDMFSAGIFASDRYGNHGLIGFYMQHKNERIDTLIHYVWSCRMMNAGLEQYVYERLGSPDITVIEPVSNPIKVFEKIDWIEETTDGDAGDACSDPSLMLLGSCDLTAVASYCSRNRIEFVNGVKNGVMTRYDDFGFILGEPDAVEASKALEKIPSWGKDDFTSFHSHLSSSEVLVVSLSGAVRGVHLLTDDGVIVRVHPEGLGNYIDYDNPSASFLQNTELYELDEKLSFKILVEALDYIDRSSVAAKHKFLLGANTREPASGSDPAYLDEMQRYNKICIDFCDARPLWKFVSIDDVVSKEKLIDDRHYNRMGYFDIATFINSEIRARSERDISVSQPSQVVRPDLRGMIKSGRRLNRLALLGANKGFFTRVKKIVKITPVGSLIKASLAKKKL